MQKVQEAGGAAPFFPPGAAGGPPGGMYGQPSPTGPPSAYGPPMSTGGPMSGAPSSQPMPNISSGVMKTVTIMIPTAKVGLIIGTRV
jgi:hypothetical protein